MADPRADPPVWFITGASGGLGRALMEEVLRQGHRCVATTRRASTVDGLVAAYPGHALVLALDVTSPDEREEAVSAAEKAFGRIDALVNNAGYGYLAAIEEGKDEEIRALFEVNLFTPAALIRRVLPAMRARGSGRIINLSSVGGVVANASSGYYASTKFALEGLSEALAKEVGPLGIRVMLVEPGPFRTDFYGRSIHVVEAPIGDYAATAAARREKLAASHGRQAGDPVRAAQVIFRVAQTEKPPLRLPLGRDAVYWLRRKYASSLEGLEQWEAAALEADYPEG